MSRYEHKRSETLELRPSCPAIFLPLFDHLLCLAAGSQSRGYAQRAGRELAQARKVAAYTVCPCGRPALRQTDRCAGHTPSCWRIYDNGGATLDRFSVLVEDSCERWDGATRLQTCLGLSEGGRAFSQFTEATPGRHLGKRVSLESLDGETRAHIMARLAWKDEA